MRYRVTLRGEGTELRGYVSDNPTHLMNLAAAVEPLALLVIASPADDDYDPFVNWSVDA